MQGTIAHFDLQQTLGSGPMGTVYRARDTRTGAAVALKAVDPQVTQDPNVAALLRRATMAASYLYHPNIARIVEQGDEAGAYYIVSELVEGESLRERLNREGRLSESEAHRIATSVAHALNAANAQRIVHRDLKPENVLLGEGAKVAVCDFGLTATRDAVTLTRVIAFIPSPQYAAPESAESRADIRGDLYALGVMLYEMLSGRVPFEGTDVDGVLRKHHIEAPNTALLRRAAPLLSPIVLKLLEKRPARRYADPGELIDALQRVGKLDPVLVPDDVLHAADGNGAHARGTGIAAGAWRGSSAAITAAGAAFAGIGALGISGLGRAGRAPRRAGMAAAHGIAAAGGPLGRAMGRAGAALFSAIAAIGGAIAMLAGRVATAAANGAHSTLEAVERLVTLPREAKLAGGVLAAGLAIATGSLVAVNAFDIGGGGNGDAPAIVAEPTERPQRGASGAPSRPTNTAEPAPSSTAAPATPANEVASPPITPSRTAVRRVPSVRQPVGVVPVSEPAVEEGPPAPPDFPPPTQSEPPAVPPTPVATVRSPGGSGGGGGNPAPTSTTVRPAPTAMPTMAPPPPPTPTPPPPPTATRTPLPPPPTATPQPALLTFGSGSDWDVFYDTAMRDYVGSAQPVCLRRATCTSGGVIWGADADWVSISGADWIWAPGYNRNSWDSDAHEFVFAHCFGIPGAPLGGSLEMAVDHGTNVYVNGRLVEWVVRPYVTTTVDIGRYLRSGNNCVSFWADNEDFCDGCAYNQNPAGLIVRGAVRYRP